MNLFARSLERDILTPLGKAWGSGLNPLVLIGLTEAILDLGLSEQQLHAAVRSYSRQLSAQVHPDRAHGFTKQRQQEIIGAFNAIDNFELFCICLIDFKNAQAEERHEIGVLREAVKQLRERVHDTGIESAKLAERERNSLKKAEQIIFDAHEVAHKIYAEQWNHIEAYKAEFRESVHTALKNREDAVGQRETVAGDMEARMGINWADVKQAGLGVLLENMSPRRDTRWWRAPLGFG
jgi:uncharacterized protein YoxC